MDITEALRIADVLEQDDVISPVALALRALAKEYKDVSERLVILESNYGC